jgi:hypothetical protein
MEWQDLGCNIYGLHDTTKRTKTKRTKRTHQDQEDHEDQNQEYQEHQDQEFQEHQVEESIVPTSIAGAKSTKFVTLLVPKSPSHCVYSTYFALFSFGQKHPFPVFQIKRRQKYSAGYYRMPRSSVLGFVLYVFSPVLITHFILGPVIRAAHHVPAQAG